MTTTTYISPYTSLSDGNEHDKTHNIFQDIQFIQVIHSFNSKPSYMLYDGYT